MARTKATIRKTSARMSTGGAFRKQLPIKRRLEYSPEVVQRKLQNKKCRLFLLFAKHHTSTVEETMLGMLHRSMDSSVWFCIGEADEERVNEALEFMEAYAEAMQGGEDL